jgi:exoribonuclease R
MTITEFMLELNELVSRYLEDSGDPSILAENLREMADDVFEEDEDEDPNGAWNDTSAELH